MDTEQEQTISHDKPAKPEMDAPREEVPDKGSKPDLISPEVTEKEIEPEQPTPEMDPDANSARPGPSCPPR